MSEEVDPCHDCGHVRGPHRPGCSCSCHRTGYLTDQPEPLPVHDNQPEPYTLAEAEVIARHAGKLNWWAARIMRELDTVRAQNVELRKLLAEERRNYAEYRNDYE